MKFTSPVYSRVSVPIGATRIIESEYALSLPTAKPRTDDMRAMVDHLRQLGQIMPMPAAFQTDRGMVVHPKIMKQIQKHFERKSDEMRNALFARAAFGRWS